MCIIFIFSPQKSYQVRKKGVGMVEEKQLILHEEGRMDDAVTFARSQEEEARTAGVIRKCTLLFNQFIKYVFRHIFQVNNQASEIIIEYFTIPITNKN